MQINGQLHGQLQGQSQVQDLLISDKANRSNNSFVKSIFSKETQKNAKIFNQNSQINFSIDEWEAF